MPGTYDDLKKDALVELADSRGIDSSGNKAEIVNRLEAADEAAANADQPTEELGDVAEEIEGGPDAEAGTIDTADEDDGEAAPDDGATEDLPAVDLDDEDDEPEDAPDEDDEEDEEDDEDDEPEPEPTPEPEPEPAVAEPELAPVGHQPVHAEVPESDLANQGRRPTQRGAKPWDKIKVEVLSGLRESAADLWKEGEEQLAFLGAIAEDIAKQTWLAKFGDHGQKRNAPTNLKHLAAQVKSRAASVKQHLVKQGDSLLLRVLQTTIRVAIGALVSAVI